MSIQWTLIAGCMYTELTFTIVMLIPFISPKRWHSFFKSRFLASISNMSHIYFRIFLAVLVLCFLDAIREMRKYSGDLGDHSHGADHPQHLDVEMQQHMRLFRAQRNFYISGFSLFLWVVLQRLMTLISTLALSQAGMDAAISQAKSASKTAEQLMSQQQADGGVGKKEVENNANEMKELKQENNKMKAEKEAVLKQAESVSREYDRLMKELATVQAQLAEGESKKDH
uniref:Endoplasmic reticulum transmembrane protein n=1 Tax=Hirondellea gigas TaxID=1518452 RepID=A0A2P2HXW8_9CRUS